jgi:nucleoid-associated protein YgaU
MRSQNFGSEGVRIRSIGASTVGMLAAAGAATALLRWGRSATSAYATPDEVVSTWMFWGAVALCGWLGLGSVLAVGAILPGTLGAICADLARWLTPRLVRQAMAAAIGTSVATVSLPMGAAQGAGIVRAGPAAGAGDVPLQSAPPEAPATPAPDPGFGPIVPSTDVVAGLPAASDDAAATPQTLGPAPDPGWAPTPPVRVVHAEESRLIAQPPRPSASPDGAVTVHRGDTLWHIAARHLGPGASDAEIALEWPRWYAANSEVIGLDPDRLLPGQQLQPPLTGGLR